MMMYNIIIKMFSILYKRDIKETTMSYAHNSQHFTGKKSGKRIRRKSKPRVKKVHRNKYKEKKP